MLIDCSPSTYPGHGTVPRARWLPDGLCVCLDVLPHDAQEIARLERLGDVLGRPHQLAPDLVEHPILPGEHDDRDVAIRRIAPDDLADLVAIHLR